MTERQPVAWQIAIPFESQYQMAAWKVGVNNPNEISTITRTGTLTVAGTTTMSFGFSWVAGIRTWWVMRVSPETWTVCDGPPRSEASTRVPFATPTSSANLHDDRALLR